MFIAIGLVLGVVRERGGSVVIFIGIGKAPSVDFVLGVVRERGGSVVVFLSFNDNSSGDSISVFIAIGLVLGVVGERERSVVIFIGIGKPPLLILYLASLEKEGVQ